MSDSSQHLSDEVILQFIDKELPVTRAKRVREHFSICPACRDRLLAMENTSGALIELYGSEPAGTNPGGAASRVRLKRRLAELREASFPLRSFAAGLSPGMAFIAALVIISTAFAFEGGKQIWKSRHAATGAAVQLLVPDHSLTPGAVRPVTLAEVCSANDNDLDPEVSSATEKAVFEEYGLQPRGNSRQYQIDYLVSPQLGGTSDIKNLWPEPYFDSRWNAHTKDDLERRLHGMVCHRTIDLAIAQRKIAANWIAAYKKYIGTGRPS